MKIPERIDLNLDQVDALLKRVESGSLQSGDYEIIKAMVETIHLLSQAVDQKATSIRRLLRMLFGDRSEKIEKVLKETNQLTKQKKPPEDKTDKPKGHGRIAAVSIHI
jgi:hypothetical protein